MSDEQIAGPGLTPLTRLLVWINCAALIICGLFSFIGNIINFLDPTRLVMSAYIFLFGCIALISRFGFRIAREHFGFLDGWFGLAAFFIFVGTMGISFGITGVFTFAFGIFSCVVGVMCIVDHLACRRRSA